MNIFNEYVQTYDLCYVPHIHQQWPRKDVGTSTL